jgi:hypothetical protein
MSSEEHSLPGSSLAIAKALIRHLGKARRAESEYLQAPETAALTASDLFIRAASENSPVEGRFQDGFAHKNDSHLLLYNESVVVTFFAYIS